MTVVVHIELAIATFGNVTHIRIGFICVVLAKVAKASKATVTAMGVFTERLCQCTCALKFTTFLMPFQWNNM